MKKHAILIPVCIFALLLGSFLLIGHKRRDEISDILAQQIYVSDDSEADVWINSSDTVYNWVHRSLDFSIGVNSQHVETVSAVFVLTGNQDQRVTITADKKKVKTDGETVFTASVPYQKLSEGSWTISAFLLDSGNDRIPLKNENVSDHALTICTFHVH